MLDSYTRRQLLVSRFLLEERLSSQFRLLLLARGTVSPVHACPTIVVFRHLKSNFHET